MWFDAEECEGDDTMQRVQRDGVARAKSRVARVENVDKVKCNCFFRESAVLLWVTSVEARVAKRVEEF
jgi:hypothetical protein